MNEQEKEEKMKRIIQSHIERERVYDALQEKLEEEKKNIEDLDFNDLLTYLPKEIFNNIVDDLENMDKIEDFQKMEGLGAGGFDLDIDLERKKEAGRNLILKIKRCWNFYQLLKTEDENLQVQLFVSFLNQKFQSQIVEVDKEPKFNEMFVFEIDMPDGRTPLNLNHLKKLDQKIQFAICYVNPKTRERQIYALKQLEWRFVLVYDPPNFDFKLGLYEDEDTPAGVIELTLEIYPKLSLKDQIQRTNFENQLQKEIEFKQTDTKAFYEYSKKWWLNFKENYPQYSKRIIKIYTENEFGMYVPTPAYVYPLHDITGIDTPLQAARFVSLLPLRFKEITPGEKKEYWMTYQNMLVQRGCDVHDHATLLCGFFLGFNLDAYVIIGTSDRGGNTWVMTKRKIDKGPGFLPIFWDPMTGKQYYQHEMQDEQKNMFKKVGCVFNNTCFYVNINQYDYAVGTDFNFEDRKKWQKIDEQKLNLVRPMNLGLTLDYPNINIQKIEQYVDRQLRNYVTDFRMINGMTTRLDQNLEQIFKAKLNSQEQEHVYDSQTGQEEFEQGLKNYMPPGCVLKHKILSFTHFDIRKIFFQFKNDERSGKYLFLKGLEKLFFGVKCKLVPYPDNFFVIWVALIVRYKK